MVLFGVIGYDVVDGVDAKRFYVADQRSLFLGIR
jgi:hypothetical protein